MKVIYLSLGGNSGNTYQNLQVATNYIYERIGFITATAPIYKTASWGFNGPDFLNTVVEVKTSYSSTKVLNHLLEIEQLMGRIRDATSTGYQDRVIDIDLLFYEDAVIDVANLQVPHPRLQQRNFVLFPMADIAPEFEHPVLSKCIRKLLEESNDTQSCTKISQELTNPIRKYNLQDYQFITVEGNIGAGKTTLASLIAEEFNAKLVLERFKENPFLPQFYKDKERYAFPLEMSFLADRYQQLLDDIGQFDLFKNFMIADYDSYKSLIFAQITLQEDEFTLYKKLHGIMYKELVKPGLYIYLYQNTERLLSNIKKRGREYEQNISEDYLMQINQGYLEFIRTKIRGNIKIIDISELDFVENRTDYISILNKIAETNS